MEHHYQHLFSTICRILRSDYAGMPLCAERFDPRYYAQAIGQAWNDGILDELQFLRYVSQMLACMGDRHLGFSLLPGEGYEPYTVGFSVRRFGDALYVTDLCGEDRLTIGEAITAVNGGSPAHHRRVIQKNFFYSDAPEREDWTGLLKMAQTVTTDRLGEIELRHYPTPDRRRPPRFQTCGSAAVIDPGTLDGSGRAAAMLAVHEAELSRAERIVWDLRACGGRSEDDLLPLLGWLCAEDTTEGALLGSTELYVNYTPRNCALRIAALRAAGDTPEIAAYVRELEGKAGLGLTAECEAASPVPVRARAKRVVVLTDGLCRDAGETLALAARRAGARLIGRETMGTHDLCGDVAAVLDGRFVFRWPTAISKAAYEGRSMPGRGIEPDVIIPFDPDELRHDRLLQAALTD